ncbi:hypothetical protein ACNHYB_03835 [Isoptericola jiangsuensis]|uniref:hypothetical protein n=1 Tax=Isoptericola jiangsuensis TaxID=548579 RepID=UPI003AAF0FCA
MSVVPEVPTRTARTGRAERHAQALAALRSAEHGYRRGPLPDRGAAEPPDAVRVAPPRTEAPAPRPRRSVAESSRDGTVARPVHPALASLLPGGVLPVGGVLAVQGSTSLLLGLLATPSHEGAWTALVGAPAVGLLAAADAGMALGRTVVVPAPGPDAPVALAALLDGMDVVVVGPAAVLDDVDRRRLSARARQRDAVLVSTVRWPGAHVTLDARGGSWSGADAGAGWLRRRTLSVLRTGRGAAARPVEIDVEVPLTVSRTTVASTVASTGAAAPARAKPTGQHLRIA